MTFGQEYLTHLRVIQKTIGMGVASKPILYRAKRLCRFNSSKRSCPTRVSWVKTIQGRPRSAAGSGDQESTREKTYYIYITAKHQDAYRETGAQGRQLYDRRARDDRRMMFLTGNGKGPLFNVDQFIRIHSWKQLNRHGLPWPR